MISEVILVYSNPDDRKEIEDYDSNKGFYVSYLDYGSRKEKKHAWELMEEWGTRRTPFAVLKDENGKVVQCLYSEDGNKVIQNLKLYL